MNCYEVAYKGFFFKHSFQESFENRLKEISFQVKIMNLKLNKGSLSINSSYFSNSMIE